MLIGLAVLMTGAQLVVLPYSMVQTLSRGVLGNKQQYLGQVQKWNIKLWLMQRLKSFG
jgi:hypothetical protein